MIGTIGAILAAKDVLNFDVALGGDKLFNVLQVLNVLLFFWGAYAILTAIGISDDIIPWPRICEKCAILGDFCFILGIVGAGIIVGFSLANEIMKLVLGENAALVILGFILIFLIVVEWKRTRL